MVGAIAFDMGNRLVHTVHQLGRDDHVHEFPAEIIRCRGNRARNFQQLTLAAHLDPGLHQVLDQDRAVFGVKLPVDQQTFRRATNPGAAGLGVQNHAPRFVQIGIAVGIDVANAFQMGENRHPRFGLDQTDQTLAAARHDHVDIIGRGQHR